MQCIQLYIFVTAARATVNRMDLMNAAEKCTRIGCRRIFGVLSTLSGELSYTIYGMAFVLVVCYYSKVLG